MRSTGPDLDTDLLCPRCTWREWVSPDDPDASLSQMVGHFRRAHPREDELVLLGKVRVVAARA